MHSVLSDNSKESRTTKGVNIATKFNERKDTLFNIKVIRHKMERIQSKKHKIGTYEINKISLSCNDDKRFVLDDGIHTLAYFHRFLQMIIKNMRFSQIRRIQKDFHKSRDSHK